MRDLTEIEIKDLESRGIKPGVLLRCPNYSSFYAEFTFNKWSEFTVNNSGCVVSKKPLYGKFGLYVWLKNYDDYATPVKQ